MKTKEEMDKIYLEVCKDSGSKEIASEYCGFIKGYTQCQQDMTKELYEFGKLVLDTFHSEGKTHSGKDRLARVKFDEWFNQVKKTNMKPQDLRIGNLVYGISDRIEKIVQISETKVTTDLVKINAPMEIELTDISPITLTDAHFIEWGFYKDGEYWSRGIDDYKFCFKYRDWAKNWAFYQEFTDSPFEHDEGVKYPISFDIEFVHQIQNLWFALLHKEITDKED